MSALVYDYKSIAAHMKGELASRPGVLHLSDEQVSRLREEWEKGKNGSLSAISEPYCTFNYNRGYGKYSVSGCCLQACHDAGVCRGDGCSWHGEPGILVP